MSPSFLKAKSYTLSARRGFTRTNFSPENSRGFTLIELLVVIAIIGILSSVVLVSLNSARTKARDTKRVADIKQIQLALEMYYEANGRYPTDIYADANSLKGSTGGASFSVVPTDPRSTAAEPSFYKYAVNNATTPTAYHLGAELEQSAAQTILEDSDKDFDSTTVWVGVTQVSPSRLFDGADTGALPVYDVSNQ